MQKTRFVVFFMLKYGEHVMSDNSTISYSCCSFYKILEVEFRGTYLMECEICSGGMHKKVSKQFHLILHW